MLTLAAHLGEVQLGKLVKKKLFGGYEIPLLQFIPVGLWLFSNGAVFGRARRDKIEIISKIFVGLETLRVTFERLGFPNQAINDEQVVSSYIRQVGSDGVKNYRDTFHKDPESLIELWLKSFAPPDVDFRDFNKAKILAKKKIRLGDALINLDGWFCVGISFGANFPELMERMWRQEYEMVTQESWTKARKAGVELPEEITKLKLEDMEQQVLVGVAYYVNEYYPELVSQLGLSI